MEFGTVILAGGKSRRMGKDKAELMFGKKTFLEKLIQEFRECPELLISVAAKKDRPDWAGRTVEDVYPGCGPMAGLHAALKASRCSALLAVPCDVPLFSPKIAEQMYEECSPEVDAVVAVSADGRIHPLCGIYKKSCVPAMERRLEQGNYRMQELLKELRVKTYQVKTGSWRLQNVNTPEELERLTVQSVLAVSGWKNAGKTTLIERLIPGLTESGLRVAVIKHDGHSFEPDVPGTDSSRFFQAGACASMVYDGAKYALTRREKVSAEELFLLSPDADLFLLEGFKESGYPKIEILRANPKEPPIPGLKGRLAYVLPEKERETGPGKAGPGGPEYGRRAEEIKDQEVPVFGREEIRELTAFILELYEAGKLRARFEPEEGEK